MESIDILTGQHVTIKYEPASVVRRMFAFILDYIFISAYLITLFFIFFNLLNISPQGHTVLFVFFCILILPVLCYHVVFETLMIGQTPGKVIAKIRVTNLDGSTPNFVSYFLRWILFIIDMIPYGGLGALLIIFSKNHQRLGDMAAGTTVVKIQHSFAKFSMDNFFNNVPQNYKPVFPQVEQLTEGQIRFITKLLENLLHKRTNDSSAEQLTKKIKEKLNIETKLNAIDFLKTIVSDYNYYASASFM